MTKPTIYDLADDRASLVITYHSDPPVCVSMKTDALEAQMGAMGLMRTAMLPPIPEFWELGQRVQSYRNPVCSIEHDQLAGDVLLHLRDERFGWLHFIFTKSEAGRLGAELIVRANAEPPAPAGRA